MIRKANGSGQIEEVRPTKNEAEAADQAAIVHMQSVRPPLAPQERGSPSALRKMQKPVLESEEGLDAIREHLLHPYRLEVRFWARVQPQRSKGGCWHWTGALMATGYGHFSLTKVKSVLAHRMSWALSFGPIPKGLFICHECNNKPCVRPSHIYAGSARVNNLHAVRDGRFPMFEARYLFSRAQVRNIRKRADGLYKRGLLGPGAPLRSSPELELILQVMQETGASRMSVTNIIRGNTYQHDLVAGGPPSRSAYPGRYGAIGWPVRKKTR
jgi:hypothetical protein